MTVVIKTTQLSGDVATSIQTFPLIYSFFLKERPYQVRNKKNEKQIYISCKRAIFLGKQCNFGDMNQERG